GFGKHYKRCGNRVPLRSAVPLLMPLYASEAPFKVGWINPPEPFRRRCLTILLKSSLVSCPRNNIYFAGSQLAVFQGANERPYLNHTGRESKQKNSQLAPAQRVAMKMGRRRRCSSVTSRTTFMLPSRPRVPGVYKVVRDAP